MHELMHRSSNGLTVRLLWDSTGIGNRLYVEVSTFDGIGGNLLFAVPEASALDAFEHPFVYAPKEGIENYA